jgi:hypothetical protein
MDKQNTDPKQKAPSESFELFLKISLFALKQILLSIFVLYFTQELLLEMNS